ncbi:MAG: NAD(P)-dependent alcohol dehydrogenase [Candidatus Methylophosphatis roskildensis]
MGRRDVLKAGAAMAAAPLLSGVAAGAQSDSKQVPGGNGPISARAYGATQANAPLAPLQIQRRALGPNDVLLDVLYCGICHSDIHQARNEWSDWGPTVYPCVPGHEVIGRVVAVGKEVTKFKVGDIGGVGCMVDSCRTCDPCRDDREQNCARTATFTYNSPDRHGTAPVTYGGYSDKIVVTEHFVIRIPPGADFAATAPLLCAGITTFSPMQHWKLAGGQRVGVVGLGGLGHMAVKLAAARNADVTVFTTSPGKVADARRLGAKQAVLWSDAEAMKRLANTFDLLISTVPKAYPMNPLIDVLKPDGTLVNVGAMEEIRGVTGINLVYARKRIAGSMIGGIAETQEVIDYCAARNIKAEIELVRADQINQAYDRVVKKDVRYRFVIDMASLKA